MKSFLRYFLLLCVSLLLICAAGVDRGWASFPASAAPRFDAAIDAAHRDAVAREKPQVVLLGDSMAEENVDLPALSEAVGRTIHLISYPGSASALWYLSIKNNILASPHKPQAVVILFRDTTLTAPAYRAGGQFGGVIDSLAGADEELLLRLAYLDMMNPLEKAARRYFPLYMFGPRFRDGVDILARLLPSRPPLRCGKRCVDAAFLDLFNFRNLAEPTANDPVAQEESVLYTRRALDFHRQAARSFLPEIIRLCRENGIHLIVVRGKTISFADIPKPAGLDGYMRDLEDYLTANGVSFADLEADARLDAADYIDRFHVQPEARGTYTQMLAEALLPLLP